MNKIKFEKEINDQLNKIGKNEKGFFIKSPTPIRVIPTKNSGNKMIYSEKALCDFLGIISKKFIIIEAKEVSGIRFDFSRLKKHQIKQLASIKRHGGCSFIFFKLKKINKIVSVTIDNYLIHLNRTTKKSININALLEIGVEIKLEDLEIFLISQANYY